MPDPLILFADRLPPLVGGMEMHAEAFIEHFTGHPDFPLLGTITKNGEGHDCLSSGGKLTPTHAAEALARIRPRVVFFNSGRWIEQLHRFREVLPKALFVYRTGGNEILKAPAPFLEATHEDRQRWWCLQLNSTVDRIITNSRYTDGRLSSIGLNEHLFLRCVGGVHELRNEPLVTSESTQLRWFNAARMVPYKNQLQLLELVAHVAASGLDVRLRIAGDGPLRERLERRTSTLNLGNRVQFLGQICNRSVLRELQSSDYFIQLSMQHPVNVGDGNYLHSECMGRALLEACAAGVFVIASRTGAIPEIITPDRGMLVDAADSGQLFEQVTTLMRGPIRRGRPTNEYSWNAIFARYTADWRQACGF